MNIKQDDAMGYSFTEKEADTIIEYAVGDQFIEHKSFDGEVDYKEGYYYCSFVGADGARWLPIIDIQNVSSFKENKVKVKGMLQIEHDIYSEVFTYDFDQLHMKTRKVHLEDTL